METLNSTSRVLEDSARGGFYLTLGNIISGIVSALSLIIIARVLGSEQYGVYTIAGVIPSLLLLFVDPGINQGLVKFSASLRVKEENKRLSKLLIHGLSFKTMLGLIASSACFIFSDQFAGYILNRPDIGGFVKLSSALVVLQTILSTANSIFTGLDKMEYNAATTIVQSIAKAVIAPILVILGFSIAGALLGYVISFILACLLAIFLFVHKIYGPLNHSKGDPESFSKNLRMLMAYGLPLYVSVLIGGFTLQYRNILLSNFTSNYEIGNFQAAMNFNTIITSISIPIATVLVPAFSKLEEKKKDMREFFEASVKYTTMAILPIVILLMFYAEEIVQVVYGEGYELAPDILILYTSVYLLSGLGLLILGSFFSGIGETKINLKITTANAATMIVLAPLLTYHLKVNGITMALISSSVVGTLYGLCIARRTFKIIVNTKTMAKIYLASLASALPLFAMKAIPLNPSVVTVTLGAAAYIITYLLAIPITRSVTLAELEEVRLTLGKIKPLRIIAYPVLNCEEKIILKIT